ADRLQMKLDVRGPLLVERVEQEAPHLLAARTSQLPTPPHRADGVFAPIASLHQVAKPTAQVVRTAQGLLDLGRVGVAEGVVEIRAEHLGRDHDASVALAASSGKTSTGSPASRMASPSLRIAANRMF